MCLQAFTSVEGFQKSEESYFGKLGKRKDFARNTDILVCDEDIETKIPSLSLAEDHTQQLEYILKSRTRKNTIVSQENSRSDKELTSNNKRRQKIARKTSQQLKALEKFFKTQP